VHLKDIFHSSEPTSVPKAAKIFPAIAVTLDSDSSNRSPIMFSSPNVSELAQMYQTASGSGEDLIGHDRWWRTINNFSLGSEFRTDLELLARRDVSDHDSPKGTLSFIIDEGVSQMAVNLLPFFQHLVIKCGERGVIVVMRIHGQDIETSGWRHEKSNALRRCVVATNSSTKEMVVIQHFPAPQADKVVNVTGAGDSIVGYLLASLICNPGVLNHPNTLKDVIDAAQTAAVLTLQSSHAVSPLLSAMQS
jgi:pseudouridine-5'-phosphate glycosidase/pseudouridine kinase